MSEYEKLITNLKILELNLINDITDYFKYQLISEINENTLPVFNDIVNIIMYMNKYTYSYTLKDIDDLLFENLLQEIKKTIQF